ncbi:MAG: NAD(P)H-dependent glycerol-3-phosphate dehydrogenase [Bacteroidetes bacterium]|nr:NAD(P)H-dependent glycerol-3-phosphate dehydrogenase [Bacteroidota bacterium]
MQKPTIGVLGSGSWGTALVSVLLQNGHTVHWWVRREAMRQHLMLHGRNPDYLPNLRLETDRLLPAEDCTTVVNACTHLLVAIPSAHMAESLSSVPRELWPHKQVASASKGLIPGTQHTICQWLHTQLKIPQTQLAVISGPSHSEEVALQQHTWLTVAGTDAAAGAFWAESLARPWLHLSTTPDLAGVEWGAILKNVYAIAAGLALGLGHGNNLVAALIAASLNEMQDLLDQLSPLPGRRMGTAPLLGDLLTTCYSPHSRNRKLGDLIGRGRTPREALDQMSMVAEGYYSTHTLVERCQLQAPILHMVYRCLYGDAPASTTFEALLPILH